MRLLRETLGMTQEEVSARSVDQDGRILHRIEVGYVESGRNMASTRRVRTSLARAFGVPEDDLFDYLEGRVDLQEFLTFRENQRRRSTKRTDAKKSPQELAIEVIVGDGYGTAMEARRAAAHLRETLPFDEQAELGALEWAKLLETTLRQLRREADPASASGVVPRAQSGGTGGVGKKGRRSA